MTDLVYANTGDRVWWTWLKEEVDQLFNITEIEKCISPIGGRAAIESEERGTVLYAICFAVDQLNITAEFKHNNITTISIMVVFSLVR